MTMTAEDLGQMAEQIEREVSAAMRMPTLDAMRALLNEAGIRRARVALSEAPDRLAAAQNAYREAQAVEGAARESYTQAVVEAEWELDCQVHTDGNKRYRWVPCDCVEAIDDGESESVVIRVDIGSGRSAVHGCSVCAGAGRYRRNMLADEVKAWRATEAAKAPGVVLVSAALRRAEEDTAAARDAVSVADKRLSAAKMEVQAAIAELNALAVGLAAKGA